MVKGLLKVIGTLALAATEPASGAVRRLVREVRITVPSVFVRHDGAVFIEWRERNVLGLNWRELPEDWEDYGTRIHFCESTGLTLLHGERRVRFYGWKDFDPGPGQERQLVGSLKMRTWTLAESRADLEEWRRNRDAAKQAEARPS